jgi:hypothetical protein
MKKTSDNFVFEKKSFIKTSRDNILRHFDFHPKVTSFQLKYPSN